MEVRFPSNQEFNYEVWRMDKDITTKSLFYYPAPPPYGDSTALYLPMPYLTEQGSEETDKLTREMVIDSNEIVYISLKQLTAVDEHTQDKYPSFAKLYQNYPNPFNSATKIKFRLSAATDVEIGIFTLRGQKVIRLLNERRHAGTHTIFWNGLDEFGRQVSSGIYLYRIKTERLIESKKLLLLR